MARKWGLTHAGKTFEITVIGAPPAGSGAFRAELGATAPDRRNTGHIRPRPISGAPARREDLCLRADPRAASSLKVSKARRRTALTHGSSKNKSQVVYFDNSDHRRRKGYAGVSSVSHPGRHGWDNVLRTTFQPDARRRGLTEARSPAGRQKAALLRWKVRASNRSFDADQSTQYA